jgi:hypothetical protein
MAAEEFPGSTVEFDDSMRSMIRFRIDDSTGTPLSRALPHFAPTEIDDWSEDKLREVIRKLCGF